MTDVRSSPSHQCSKSWLEMSPRSPTDTSDDTPEPSRDGARCKAARPIAALCDRNAKGPFCCGPGA